MNREQIIDFREGEAIVDICLAIATVKNICSRWTPQFYLEIGFYLSNYPEQPSPYQVLSSSTVSSITLYTYRTSSLMLYPKQEKVIDNICNFRAHVPILSLEDGKLGCQIQIFAENTSLGKQSINYDTLMNLNSYLPAFDMGLGISIEGMVETQLIGFRFCEQQEYSRVTLYKMIDTLVLEHNRLAGKLEAMNTNLSHSKIQPELRILDFESSSIVEMEQISCISQIEEDKMFQQKFQNPFHIQSLSTFPELSEIRKKTMQKIFTNSTLEKDRKQLKQFGSKFIPRTSATLQLCWGNYLRKIQEKKMIKDNVERVRRRFFEQLAYEIKHRVLKNDQEPIIEGRANQDSRIQLSRICQLKDGELGQLDELYTRNKVVVSNSVIINFEGLQICHKKTTKNSLGEESIEEKRNRKQCVVLVHGYGANSVAMMMLERILSYIYPHLDILNSKSNEVPNQLLRIQDMGRGLASEIELYLQSKEKPEQIQISFICHSLGGLVARAALVYLQNYKFNMNLFVSLSCPHLGHLYHPNRLAKIGMVAISSVKNLKVIDSLLLKDGGDGTNLRNSSIYGLSMHQGFSWFKNVHFYGSNGDGYVSLLSALIEEKKQIKGQKGLIMRQMIRNLQESLNEVEKIHKFNVKFTEKAIPDPSFSEFLLGRTSHLSFLNFPRFVNCVAMNCYKSFSIDNSHEY